MMVLASNRLVPRHDDNRRNVDEGRGELDPEEGILVLLVTWSDLGSPKEVMWHTSLGGDKGI